MNDTDVVQSPLISNGVWQSPGGDIPLFYNPTIKDNSYTPALYTSKFSQPIVGNPGVVDDCMEVPKIELNLETTPTTT